MPQEYDPRLRRCMAEIKAVMDRHEVGGFVSLASKTHSEFDFFFPNWSIAQWVMDQSVKDGVDEFRCAKIHFKHKGPDPDGLVACTFHLLLTVRDQCELTRKNLQMIYELFKDKFEIEHKVQTPQIGS